MLSANLVLDDASGDDVTYTQVVSNTIGEVRRIDRTRDSNEPRFLSIKHSQRGKGTSKVDVHNVFLSETTMSTSNIPYAGTVSLTITVPSEGSVSDQSIIDLVANLVDLLTAGAATGIADTGNITALLHGEA